MKPRLSTGPATIAVLTSLLWSSAGASADENRVLPFWSQPFPIGFTRTEAGLAQDSDDCRVRRRIRTRHGVRIVVEDRCRPVLHARD